MNAKFTFFFNSGTEGWSESWYVQGVSFGTQAEMKGNAYIAERIKHLQNGVTVLPYRISDADNPRSGYLADPVIPVNPNPHAAQDPSVIVSLNCRMYSADRKHVREFFMRGVPDTLWQNLGQGVIVATPAGFRASIDFTSMLTAQQFCGRDLGRVGGAGGMTAKVSALQADAVGRAQLSVPAGSGILTQTNKTLIIGGFRRPVSHVNGIFGPNEWAPDNVANTITVQEQVNQRDTVTRQVSATVRIAVPFYWVPGFVVLTEVGERKVGRAFFTPRGHRHGIR